MASVTLQPVSSPRARKNQIATLRVNVDLEKQIRPFVSPEQYADLVKLFPTGKTRVWGVKGERSTHWANMHDGNTLVLFREGPWIVLRGVSVYRLVSLELAEALWGADDDGELWMCIYFLDHLKKIRVLARKVNSAAGRTLDDHWQGMVTLKPAASKRVIEQCLQVLK